MSERKHHRGRRKKSNFLLNIILVIAVIVFCVSGYNLLKIGKGYKDGQDEYKKVRKLAVTQDKEMCIRDRLIWDWERMQFRDSIIQML